MKTSSCLVGFFTLVASLALSMTSPQVLAEAVDQVSDPRLDRDSSERPEGPYLQYLSYEDHIYSQSKKTELGDQVELDMAFGYWLTEDTFTRLRLETDPQENTLDSKSSKVEMLLRYSLADFVFEIDLEVNTNDGETGGITFGPDPDSEYTFIAYQPNPHFGITFYPYNFDGEVGRVFNTWDVTRLYFIQGAPSEVQEDPSEGERIDMKTIPGFEINLDSDPGLWARLGFGIATYEYPTNDDYDIASNPKANSWQRKEDQGIKGALGYRMPDWGVFLEHVRHSKADETGSLLQAATSIQADVETDSWLFQGEWTISKAGQNAFELSDDREWFEERTPLLPIYSDNEEERHDWLGKTDDAWMLKAGVKLGTLTPYLAYKYQGEHFIYRELESAHLLRTNDGTQSHGGLNRLSVGTYIQAGNVEIRPDLEWRWAKNPVFSNSQDIRQDPILSGYRNQDYLLSVTLKYPAEREGRP